MLQKMNNAFIIKLYFENTFKHYIFFICKINTFAIFCREMMKYGVYVNSSVMRLIIQKYKTYAYFKHYLSISLFPLLTETIHATQSITDISTKALQLEPFFIRSFPRDSEKSRWRL